MAKFNDKIFWNAQLNTNAIANFLGIIVILKYPINL